MRFRTATLAVLLVGLLLVAAGLLFFWQNANAPAVVAVDKLRLPASVTLEQHPLSRSQTCSDQFIAHKLPFSTGTRLREISTYISNGSGVAANDLDSDGDLDLVFASVDSESAILWNQGGLQFTEETLDDRNTRAVATVDVDGDGHLDIVFTHRGLEAPSFWRNLGDGAAGTRFTRQPLAGVEHYANAMAWGDVNGDGSLDLITGSYGAELKQHAIKEPENDAQAGLVLYLHDGDHFTPQVLERAAETLAIGVVDLDNDDQPEIVVANDFALRDRVWKRQDNHWQIVEPFDQTSHSTMSIDWGDIANNGGLALFTTDMNPYDIAPRTLAKWLPMMAQMGEHREANDPQIMANVLLVRDGRGGWRNQATSRGVSASGWSWAGRFGDLDRDGYLDLYIANGMIAADMFGHLSNAELVEENQAFRNNGAGSFTPQPEWGLASTASGRGMVMGDFDGDGDLEIVVNNLRGFAQLFENDLCGGDSLQVDLRWDDVQNLHAVGAQLALHTSAGVLRRDVRASGGYLSGDPLTVSFGIPNGAQVDALVVVWPDGKRSHIEKPTMSSVLTVVR